MSSTCYNITKQNARWRFLGRRPAGVAYRTRARANQSIAPHAQNSIDGAPPMEVSMAGLKLPGYVYLIRATGTPRYKIGRTQGVQSRLSQIQGQSPYPLELISEFWTADTLQQETRLHVLAHEYRVFGEWFELPDHWLERLSAWFSNETTLAPSKLMSDATSAERLRARRREKTGSYRFTPQEIGTDELRLYLDGLIETDAVEVSQLIRVYFDAIRIARKPSTTAPKIVAHYRRLCFRTGFMFPAVFEHFEEAVRPFMAKMNLRARAKREAKRLAKEDHSEAI